MTILHVNKEDNGFLLLLQNCQDSSLELLPTCLYFIRYGWIYFDLVHGSMLTSSILSILLHLTLKVGTKEKINILILNGYGHWVGQSDVTLRNMSICLGYLSHTTQEMVRILCRISGQPFSSSSDFKMADSDVEINVDDVCDSMAADHGVEVQTIIQGQAPIAGQADDLDFMVQEEVETTIDGDTLTVELDPVDNVIIALQNTDGLQHGGHFEDQNGGGDMDEPGPSVMVGKKRRAATRGSKGGGVSSRRKTRRSKKGSVRFTNRQIPVALTTSSIAKEAKEANEASFDPEQHARKWKRRKVPVKTLDGQFAVGMWSTGTCG